MTHRKERETDEDSCVRPVPPRPGSRDFRGRPARARPPPAPWKTRLAGYMPELSPFRSRPPRSPWRRRSSGCRASRATRSSGRESIPKLAVEKTCTSPTTASGSSTGTRSTNPNPRPVTTRRRSRLDGEPLGQHLYARGRGRSLAPERDAAGLKARRGSPWSRGSGPCACPATSRRTGLALPRRRCSGTSSMDPREERKKRIDLSQGRFEGKPDGAVTIVEYADMECGYCRFRGTQMDALLQANAGIAVLQALLQVLPALVQPRLVDEGRLRRRTALVRLGKPAPCSPSRSRSTRCSRR